MLFKKKLFILTLFVSTLTLFTSCSDDDDTNVPENPGNIVEIASATSDLSSLVVALQKANLVNALKADGPFTVLAPKNSAFQALLEAKPTWSSLDDIPVSVLNDVLNYHVISGVATTSGDLTNGQVLTTLNGKTLTVDLSDGVKFTTATGQSVSVSTADIKASNGIVHLVDEVMLPFEVPLNIVDLAIKTPQLSTLVAAVKKAGLVDALAADGTMTVFAPTNDAFGDLLTALGASSLDDVSADTLKPILLFHVLGQKVMSSELTDGYVNTLSTGPNDEPLSLQIETSPAIEFNGDATPSTTLDVEASNGVVHIIEKVMSPPNIVTLALNNAGFTSLVAALTDDRHTTNFVEVLKGDGPFTVFAPTNDAFQALLNSNNDWDSLADVPIATLDAVLKYHVVSGANVQADQLTDDQTITMLSGGTVTTDLSNGAKLDTGSAQSVTVTTTDVQGTNGVIHVIDTVMLDD